MQNYGSVVHQVQFTGNIVTQSKVLMMGAAAETLVNKLVYETELANDHVLHELEARYGALIAQYIMERMPK